jgi:hypothetical protein
MPSVEDVVELLSQPEQNVVVNLLGIALEQRPTFFADLLSRLQTLRARTGRPHWIIVDETHHLLPASWSPTTVTLPQGMYNMLLITVEPTHVAPAVLASVETIMAIGATPEHTIHTFCETLGEPPPPLVPVTLEPGEALLWSRHTDVEPLRIRSLPPRAERRRHHRKYAEGELTPDRSFYFRGPQDRLNLRAQNLNIFVQLAEGVDDETWLYHLRQGEYSRWFRDSIKDEDLATETEHIEEMREAPARDTRALIQEAIHRRYTASA